ncbi:MAG: hypothetical protein M5U12_30510 [Verrucomicrobia bacterium]|nr:hypothetical protein [Verrucomicrobiota bacterium]
MGENHGHGGDTVVLGKHEAFSENGYFFAINPTGGGGAPDKATFVVSEFVRDGVTSSASVNDGNWHQLVGVYQAGGSERIYVDGALAATGASEPVVLNNAPFLIGGSVSHGVATGRFTGLVDEVQVYDRTLSNAEVQNLFAYPAQTLASPRGEALVPGSIVYSRTTGSDGSIWALILPPAGPYLMEGTRPQLSPDGRYVAYLRDNGAWQATGTSMFATWRREASACCMRTTTTSSASASPMKAAKSFSTPECSILQVARSGAVPITLVSGHCWDDSPAADPFTGRIAFHNLSLRQIGTANAYGTGKHYLPPASGEDVYPTWSPDGQWILVANADSIQMQRGPGNLVKLRPDGSDRTVLTFVSGRQRGVSSQRRLDFGRATDSGGRQAGRSERHLPGGRERRGIIERLDTLPGDDIDWVGGIVPDSPITPRPGRMVAG